MFRSTDTKGRKSVGGGKQLAVGDDGDGVNGGVGAAGVGI